MKKQNVNALGFLAILYVFSCNGSTEPFVKRRTIVALLNIKSLVVRTTAWVISPLIFSVQYIFWSFLFFQQSFTRNKH